MSRLDDPYLWGHTFGLALSPMFEPGESPILGEHHVVLNGGHGSFGLSIIDDAMNPNDLAAWAWSSDLPHHVAVNRSDVQVVRWDAAEETQTYSLSSVTKDLERFYLYLCNDRLRSNRTVVQHLVNLFGRLRTLVAHAELPDDRSIDVFLTVLANLLSDGTAVTNPQTFGLPEDAAKLYDRISGRTLDEAIQEIRTAPGTLTALTLYPNLAIRHAGGQLFQAAHFDLVRAPLPDMFGHVDPAKAERNTRGGTHFTPPALARSIVDHALKQIRDLPGRISLTVCDPACGSGAFLHEALRGLRRVGYNGSLHILGNDISATAIAMAKFTLGLAIRDWRPAGGVTLSLNVCDSLSMPKFPAADLIVMNPPFVSIIAQSVEQKEQMRKIVGPVASSRGDYSMAFVTKGLQSLSEGGVMGTLFPANLLIHKSSMSWRQNLATKGDIRLLASIGDFGMFSQAIVHVACLVIRNEKRHEPEFTALITENGSKATSDALRELRKTGGTPPILPKSDAEWKLFAANTSVLQDQSWRILTPSQREVWDALLAAQTPTVGDIFEISQGIQTGKRSVFLLEAQDFRKLPPKERKYFRKALMSNSIRDGKIVRTYYLFFPHTAEGPLFPSEPVLGNAVPQYYRTVLLPNKELLRQRVSIVRANRSDWWGLMHPRNFGFERSQRIVSKFFGGEGSFVFDADGEYLPVTAHLWQPKPGLSISEAYDDENETLITDILRAYTAIMNSRSFMRLVAYRSVVIAGGQYDFSKRFVSDVFLPDLWQAATDTGLRDYVGELSCATKSDAYGEQPKRRQIDHLVAMIYGVPQLAEE